MIGVGPRPERAGSGVVEGLAESSVPGMESVVRGGIRPE